MEDRMLSDEILLGIINSKSGGGGGGTSNYNDLSNQPQINGNTLIGNKSASDLGLVDSDTVDGILDGTDIDSFGDVETALATKVDKVEGKGLSTNDFTDAYKTAIGDNTTAISGIKDGENINSFGGVESALSDVDDAISAIDSKIDDATTYPYADVVTINDAVPANLADCSVKVEPVQSGSGTPSPENVRSISGHTECVVTRTGFNIWKGTGTDGKAIANDGGTYNSENNFVTGYVRVFPNIKYYVNGNNWENWIGTYKNDNTHIENVRVNASDRSVIFSENVYYARFTGKLANKSTACINIFDENRNGDYEPYKGQQYTLAFGDTIYGGTVDFDSGVMTVDRAVVDLGSLSYKYISETNRFNANVTDIKLASTRTLDIMSECYEAITDGRVYANVPNNSIYNGDRDGKVFVHDNRFTDPTDLATALDGMSLVYPIAIPFTVQLTPQQIQLLQGTNTLYASTGQISVTVNGVSGAIGQVHEKVNELAEEVAEIKPVDYSTTEQDTGEKWTDGKKIYRKVVFITTDSQQAENAYSLGLQLTDVIVRYEALVTASGSNKVNSNYYVSDTDRFVAYIRSDNTINLVCASWAMGQTATVIVYYTKAT